MIGNIQTADIPGELAIPIDNAHTHVSALTTGPCVKQGYISLCATNAGNWDDVARAALGEPCRIIPSFGTHPWSIDDSYQFDRNTLASFLEHFPNAGIGEVGLDKSRNSTSSIERQKEILINHINLAKEYQRVVTLHCVRAWGNLLDVLEQAHPPRILLHGWNADESLLPAYIRLGAFFSLNRRSMSSMDVETFLNIVPVSYLLLETDDEESGLEELFSILKERSSQNITRELLHDNFTRLFLRD